MIDLLYPSRQPKLLPSPRSYMADEKDGIVEEMVPIVESSGIVIAQSSREYVHSGSKLLHPVVHLHIIDRNGNLLLQKRANAKSLYPGKWDIAVGGHVTFGETIDEALYRESEEELNLQNFNPIALTSFVYETETERELVCLFASVGRFDISPVSLEIDDAKYWRLNDIQENLGKSVFTPTFEYEFSHYYELLAALL